MPSNTLTRSKFYDAYLQHARHYESVLRTLGDIFERDGQAPDAMYQLEMEFDNIRSGQKWSAQNLIDDPNVAAICSRYGDSAPGLMVIFANSHGKDLRELQSQWLRDALIAARQLGYLRAQSAHLDRLAMDAFDRGNTQEALQLSLEAVECSARSADTRCKATAIGNCGNIYSRLHKHTEAENAYRQALSLFHELGDDQEVQSTLVNLALVEKTAKDHSEMLLEHLKRSLAESRQSGDLESELYCMDTLAENLTESDPVRAGELYERALELARQLRDPLGEASAIGGFAELAGQAGDNIRNIALRKQQLAILHLHPDPLQEANARMRLAVALFKLENVRESVENAEIAFNLFSKIYSPHASLMQEFLLAVNPVGRQSDVSDTMDAET